MRESILIILVGKYLSMDPRNSDIQFSENMKRFKVLSDSLRENYNVDFAGISSRDDFKLLDEILTFKYKLVTDNPNQLDKVCSFVTYCNRQYDWYVKIRPDLYFIELFDMNTLCKKSINARVRRYRGPARVMFGTTAGGKGPSEIFHNEIMYSSKLEDVIADDQVFIFHNDIVKCGLMSPISPERVARLDWYSSVNNPSPFHEWFHQAIWDERGLSINVTGINAIFKRGHESQHVYPGNVNVMKTLSG